MASPVSQHQADIYALSIIHARSCQRSRSRRIWPLPWISLDTSWEESVWLHASVLNWGGLPQGGGGYRTDLGWALHESCSVLRDPRGEPALQACVPWWSSWTFGSPPGGCILGAESSPPGSHSPENQTLEGTPRLVLCRDSLLRSRRRPGGAQEGWLSLSSVPSCSQSPASHYQAQMQPGTFGPCCSTSCTSPNLHSSKSFHSQSLGSLHQEALPEHPDSAHLWTPVEFSVVFWELKVCCLPG